jgi:predicted PurR-regulated permease PerM
METFLKKINDFKEIEFYRSIADRPKNASNRMIKDIDLLTNNIIIEVANKIETLLYNLFNSFSNSVSLLFFTDFTFFLLLSFTGNFIFSLLFSAS